MIRIFIVLLIISIIIINLPIVKNKIKVSLPKKKLILVKTKPKNNCIINTIRGDTCYNSNYEHCPVPSYKQCSNNNLPVSKCKCGERGFELCHIHQQFSEKCAVNNFEKVPRSPPINYPVNNSRVNMFRTEKTNFEYI